MREAVEQFHDAIQAAGLIPPDTIEADGKLRRFASNGKRNDDAGWYLLHGDGIPAGSFGDWRTGFTQTWRADIGRTLNYAEEAAHRTKIEAMRREREAEETLRKTEAQAKAAAIWKAATLASADHPYLIRKGIKANGAKLHKGALVIPMCSDSKIHSLQFINTDGDKKFLTGGRVTGCYFSIGTTKDAAALCIAEGFATGATIHETTGYPVAVAFNAGNLLAVTKAMREKFPALRLIVCADDDSQTEGNPGLTKATEAARAMGGLLAKPDFGTDRPDGATDFNDLHQAQGLEAVKRAIAGVLDSGDAMTPPKETSPTGGPVGLYKNGKPNPLPRVQITCAADIKPEAIRWLWPGWLARGKFHIFAGMAGTGKTTIAITIIATISTGGRFPDGTRAPVGNVLIWSGEDSAKDTLVPRLLAAGADMTKVHFIGDVQHGGEVRSFDPATDINAMMTAVAKIGDVALLLVDPVVNAVAGDSHKNGEVRRALQPLVDFGEKLDCAVLGISHFSKGTGGKDPMERVTGSLAFAALARVVLATGKINEGGKVKRIFCRAKSNIGLDSGGFEYDLHQKEIDGHKGVFSSYALWGQAVEGTATELLAENTGEDEGDEASVEAFLRDALAAGAVAQKGIEQECKGAGFSLSTIKRAKKRLGVVSKKDGMKGVWFWSLPNGKHEEVHEGDEEVQQNSVNPFGRIPPKLPHLTLLT